MVRERLRPLADEFWLSSGNGHFGIAWKSSSVRDSLGRFECTREQEQFLAGRLRGSEFVQRPAAVAQAVFDLGVEVERRFAGPSWFIFLDARRSDGRARIFREWRQYVNLAIGDLLPSFGARRKWHENNISLGPPPLCVETVGLVCAKR
jgi:hypothetical protein